MKIGCCIKRTDRVRYTPLFRIIYYMKNAKFFFFFFGEGDNFPFRSSRELLGLAFIPKNLVNGAFGYLRSSSSDSRHCEWPMWSQPSKRSRDSAVEGGEERKKKKKAPQPRARPLGLSCHKCGIVALRESRIVGLGSLTPLTTFYLKFVPKWGLSWQIFREFTIPLSYAPLSIMFRERRGISRTPWHYIRCMLQRHAVFVACTGRHVSHDGSF